ncbi:M1 family metallopeptidase [Sphingomonas lenta]|uniref:Aminopeptidase n=1 Tax=Sphingomonas lenta TaxID=1141887 RepID=A0A2A2SJX9_9SPHN|nr:M1 family metallopeptidase [Sphingomonas lenta]PAX09525.1 peptidase M1 [Sphingomonas lenta]
MKPTLAAALLLGVSAPALGQGQLPRTVVPVAYDITIRPNAQAMTFTGTETVEVDVKQPTATLVLNAADLDVTEATFDGRRVTPKLDAAAQTLTITLPQPARAGWHKLGFSWSGKINQSAAGLFAADYVNADGSPARMLQTQFQAPDARRFAPMWDEPAFKAKFRLSAVAPAGQLAVSNMPVASVTKQRDGTQLYRFGETPVMSSYLLFFGIGDLERKTARAGNVELGIVTRRGVGGQGEYALNASQRLLAFFNDYFGQPYPLPKLDQFAGANTSQSFAMENWGAIYYAENLLLFDPALATESDRQTIHTVVAHEIAHQWFGNLVTMRWWDDLWLNEGFASWMESKASGALNPSWEAAAQAVVGAREGAMALDATAATHPIVQRIETVEEMAQAFDRITYLKGQSVIGMLESTLGEAAFRDGIRRYMAKYKYGNTETAQLWAELEAAAGQPVREIARGFTTQPGVPLVTLTRARCEGGRTTATLTQGRFGLDAASKTPLTWRVPLVLATLGGGDARAIVSGSAGTPVAVPGCGTLVLNRGKGSYARVLYDDTGHAAIVRDYRRLSLEDRLGTLADDFALAAGGYQPLSRWTAVADRIDGQANPLEWDTLAGEMGTLINLYDGTPLEPRLRALSVAKLGPVLSRIGFEARADESPLATNLRETLVGRLGVDGDPEVARRARAYVEALRTNPTAIPPAIREPILRSFAVNASAADWDRLLELARAETNPVARSRFVALLGVSRDQTNAKRALELLRADTFSPPQRAALLRAVASQHPELAFDWAVANRALAETFVESSARAGFIVGLGQGSNDPATVEKIQTFVTADTASRGAADRTLATIAARRETADRLRAGVERWLQSQPRR